MSAGPLACRASMFMPHPDGTMMAVWVVPGASRTLVAGSHGDAVKIRVAAPPEDGRANRAVVETLEEALGATCRIESGMTSRRKRVVVSQLSPVEVADRLGLESTHVNEEESDGA